MTGYSLVQHFLLLLLLLLFVAGGGAGWTGGREHYTLASSLPSGTVRARQRPRIGITYIMVETGHPLDQSIVRDGPSRARRGFRILAQAGTLVSRVPCQHEIPGRALCSLAQERPLLLGYANSGLGSSPGPSSPAQQARAPPLRGSLAADMLHLQMQRHFGFTLCRRPCQFRLRKSTHTR